VQLQTGSISSDLGSLETLNFRASLTLCQPELARSKKESVKLTHVGVFSS
jgi:hypothetical protein